MSHVRLPNWAREVVTLLPACAHFLLSGNVHDQYFVRTMGDDGRERATLLSLTHLPHLKETIMNTTTCLYRIRPHR